MVNTSSRHGTEHNCGPPVCCRAMRTALDAARLRQEGLQLLCNKIHSDLHRIGKSPQHVTHEHTEDVLRRLNIKPPKLLFQDRWKQAFDKFRTTCRGLSPDDFLHRIPIELIQQRVMAVFQVASEAVSGPCTTSVPVTHSCPYCTQSFDSLAMLNRHTSKRHKVTEMFQRFVNLRDALHGRPQCCHCTGKFTLWTGFIHHINSCTMFNADRALQVPPCDDEDSSMLALMHGMPCLNVRTSLDGSANTV